jgi:leader peptidase (prepilin peptidase) / N-methyltransferase
VNLALGAAAACAGLAVAPVVSYAVLRWLGWRVSLPVLLGYVPARAQVGTPAVRCRRCRRQLSTAGVPSLPWLARKGRCPGCGESLPRWPLGIEIALAAGYSAAAWRVGWSWALLPVAVLWTGLVAGSIVDLLCMRIPARFVYLTGAALVVTLVPISVVGDVTGSLFGALVGATLYYAFLLIVFVASGGRMGRGDLRLGWLIGLGVGWMAWSPEWPVIDPVTGVFQALLLGSLLGSVAGVVLWVQRRRWNAPFAYGPWLSLGGFAALLLAAPGPV